MSTAQTPHRIQPRNTSGTFWRAEKAMTALGVFAPMSDPTLPRYGNGVPFELTAAIKPLILLVDDNEDDVLPVTRTFERAGVRNPIFTVKSGIEEIGYLNGDAPYSNRAQCPIPEMVLLDIKIPGTDGFDVLRWIRRQPQFVRLCVVMLTSSDEIRDVNQAYQFGATSFLVKPLDLWNAAELSKAVDRLVAKSSTTAGTIFR